MNSRSQGTAQADILRGRKHVPTRYCGNCTSKISAQCLEEASQPELPIFGPHLRNLTFILGYGMLQEQVCLPKAGPLLPRRVVESAWRMGVALRRS